jgi:hypothetical protein
MLILHTESVFMMILEYDRELHTKSLLVHQVKYCILTMVLYGNTARAIPLEIHAPR